ncbi:MAG TPA: nuclear transport factor 2 family protein [Telluria sp.]|nr:nuclear transport factor 2 family protein [Telluria sp.]
MKNSDHLELINRYLDAYNAFDVDGMLAVLDPEVRFENYSGGALTAAANGIGEFRQLAERAKSLFSEREQRITAIESRDGALIASIAYRGRLAADIPDGARTGTVLDLRGTSEFSFDQGLIAGIVDRS